MGAKSFIAGALTGALTLVGVATYNQVNNSPNFPSSQPAVPDMVVMPQTDGGQQLIIRASRSNSCSVDLVTTGIDNVTAKIHAQLDSGADGWLAITAKQAQQMGFKLQNLKFNHEYEGWGITGKEAYATLQELRLGTLTLQNVPARVAGPNDDDDGTSDALVGTQILSQFHFQMRPGYCELTVPKPPEPKPPLPTIAAPRPKPVPRKPQTHFIVS